METAVRKIGTPTCRCGCNMLVDLDTLDYYCAACGCRLTRAEYRKLEEAFEEDAKAFY